MWSFTDLNLVMAAQLLMLKAHSSRLRGAELSAPRDDGRLPLRKAVQSIIVASAVCWIVFLSVGFGIYKIGANLLSAIM
jgi:hypothetical protein